MAAIEPAIPSTRGARNTLSAAKVYTFYQALHDLGQGQPGGSLLLYEPLDKDGYVAALAGNIAGVATLGIDHDSAALKQAVRDGVCGFLVNNLDEALRILKNEVRKKQPVSVCLQQNFGTAVVEMVDRGVQPDFLALKERRPPLEQEPATRAAVETMRARGATAMLVPCERLLDDARLGVAWTALSAPALWLPKIDAVAAPVIDQADEQRQRWLHFASRYLRRLTDGTHYLPMTAAEGAEFQRLVKEAITNKEIDCEVRIAIEDASDPVSELSARP